MNTIGKPDARNGHVRFDERGRETGRRSVIVCTRARHRLYNVRELVFPCSLESRIWELEPIAEESLTATFLAVTISDSNSGGQPWL